MKWSEFNYNDFYIPFDENQRAIRGFWLVEQKINLENLPMIFKEPFGLFESQKFIKTSFEERKVYLNDIIGTSHHDYGDMEIIQSYMRLKRASEYIIDGLVTKSKYNRMLRKPIREQDVPVALTQNEDGTYFVDGNGNHRVILYKMMLLSEISLKHSYVFDKNFNFNRELFKDVKRKYWINAKVNIIDKTE